MDINKFKSINDTYGHVVGDKILIEFAERLNKELTANEFASRFGGDEFVILMENADDKTRQRLRSEIYSWLERLNASGELPCRISLSMGMAEFDMADVDKFIHDMDQKMYEDKRAFYQQEGNDRRCRRRERDEGEIMESCEAGMKEC